MTGSDSGSPSGRGAGTGSGRGRGRRARRQLDRDSAWDYLLDLLSRQAYTVHQLRQKLARRDVAAETADELLTRLAELGLVDDDAYAERFVAGRSSSHGRLALRRDLLRRGVDEEVLSPHVGALGSQQQAAAATELLRKNAWRYRPSDPPEDADDHERSLWLRRAEAKARAFLGRRGFDPDAVQEAISVVGWFEE